MKTSTRFAFLALGLLVAANGAAGSFDLDPTLNGDGVVTTDFGRAHRGEEVLVQPDGRIILVGTELNRQEKDFGLVRYNTDGSPDLTFGFQGRTTWNLGVFSRDDAEAAVLQSDGKIVVVGTADSPTDTNGTEVGVVRFNADGSFDAQILIIGADAGNAVAMQADGKIVVGGRASGDFLLFRLNTDLSLDASFGIGGFVAVDVSIDDTFEGVAVQADGKIVAAGDASNVVHVMRFNPNGSLDATFGTGGIATASFGGANQLASMLLQPDGRIVVAGWHQITFFESASMIGRFNANGTVDTSFNGTGFNIPFPASPTFSRGSDVAIQADGKLLVSQTGNSDFETLRFNAGGTLDTGFGSGGLLTTDLSSNPNAGDRSNSVVVQADGRILVGGTSPLDLPPSSGGEGDFTLVRYESNSNIDTGFGGAGVVTTDFGRAHRGEEILVQPDGRMILVGTELDRQEKDFGLARYNTDGSPDLTFGFQGRATWNLGVFSRDDAEAAVLQSDGKIVVVGTADSPTDTTGTEVGVVRFNADGSFDAQTLIKVDFGDSGRAVAVQADGKILVGGHTIDSGFNSDMLLIRLNPDLSLDAGFGVGGFVTVDSGTSGESITDLEVLAGGKILAGANAVAGNIHAVRFNSDGSLDATFGTGGLATALFGGMQNQTSAMVLQADGKFVVTGLARPNMFESALLIARFNADGSVDPSFNGTGFNIPFPTTSFTGGGDVAIQADGKLLVAQNRSGGNFDTLRFNADGTLDTSFGSGGRLTTDLSGMDFPVDRSNTVAVQSDGRILVAGTSPRELPPNSGGEGDFALVRYVEGSDNDGVPDVTEDGAPNGGDGNNDGTRDALQDNVASLPSGAAGNYVTIESPPGTALMDVRSIPNPSPGDTPAVAFPVGFLSFTVTGVAVGGAADVMMFLEPGVFASNYYKYGPEPGDLSNHWYAFLFDGTTGAEFLSGGNIVVLHFVDGDRGDRDLTANGVIEDPGAPAAQSVETVLLLATNSVAIGQGARINSGDVIVDGLASGQTLDPRAQLSVGKNAFVADNLKADSIRVDKNANTDGDLFCNDLDDRSGQGLVCGAFSLPVLDAFPPFVTGGSGGPDVSLGKGEVIGLSPGSYGHITLKKNAGIVFDPGTYDIASISGKKGVSLIFDGASEVRVAGAVRVEKDSVVGAGSGVAASDVVFYVNGTNQNQGNPGAGKKPAEFGMNSDIKANFYVPNGTLAIGKDGTAVGAFIARDLSIGKNVQVSLDSFFAQ